MNNLKDIRVPIPHHTGITIDRSGRRVLRVLEAPYDAKAHYTRPKRVTIGYLVDDSVTQMRPSKKYADLYVNEWKEHTGEDIKPTIKKLGIYALVEAVNATNGILDVLTTSLGKERAHSLIDFAMYSLLFKSAAAADYEARMHNQLVYSGVPLSDSYYSDLFEKKLSKEDILQFKKAWAMECKKDGVDEVWLCIDGSNDDCDSQGVDIAEPGHNKSGTNKNIVSFTYAVSQTGRPVTFDVYRGGLVDAKAMHSIIAFLKACGIKVKGVILDRGYCNSSALQFLNGEKLQYVIMVKGHPQVVVEIMNEYAGQIRRNPEYLIRGTKLYGVQKACQLFKDYVKQDYLTLFFDNLNAAQREDKFLENMNSAISEAEIKLAKGEEPQIPTKFRDILGVDGKEKKRSIIINTENLKAALDAKGYSCIVTSEEMKPETVNDMYVSRNASEKQYRIFKTDLGYGTVGVYYTPGVYSKFTVGFISSVIRYEVQEAAKALKMKKDVNQLIDEMDKLEMLKINDIYIYSHTENTRTIQLLGKLNTEISIFDVITKEENDRLAGRQPLPRHRKTGPKKTSALTKPNKSVQKRGPKSGFTRSEVNADGTPRKKPGPKPGFTRGEFNADGSRRQKPGPKPGSHRAVK